MPTSDSETSDAKGRDRIVEYLEDELIGPVIGPEEVIDEKPQMRYTMGVLFPRKTSIEDLGEEAVVDDATDSPEPAPPEEEERADDPVNLSGQWMPASIGLSFYFTGTECFEVDVWGASYESLSDNWSRSPIAAPDDPETVTVQRPSSGNVGAVEVLDGRALLHTHWRSFGDGHLITATLVNARDRDEDDQYPDAEDCVFQVGFKCRVPDGQIREYPDVNRAFAGEEERELELMYHRHRTFAVGHGCAASWPEGPDAGFVQTDLLPTAVVPDLTHELDSNYVEDGYAEALRISYLASPDTQGKELCDSLDTFLKGYERWIGEEEERTVPDYLKPARNRIVGRLKDVHRRMKDGIELLREDEEALRAFRLANRAMLMQMYHGRDELGGERSKRNQALILDDDFDYLELTGPAWRPFQLAFQLLTLNGLADYDSPEREIVDLIWFPTGGGKTEAYLAVAAFEILRRRLVHREAGAGTAVITRYTLRLLTSQQFQRSARLICALELLRRERPEALGDTPIRIGFWAGKTTSPNGYQEAKEKRRDMIEAGAENPFQLKLCPWCGTELVPTSRTMNEEDYGVRADNSSFDLFCPTDECEFHDRLPISVVDDDLYDNPPTFLIGTVDKFAQLAWRSGPGAFFGENGRLAPTLIIQDELHLLSGPLGTTAAVYETAFHELMRVKDRRPKVVASTATIRSAGEQVGALFNRDVQVFPPPGTDESDSFFARVDETAPGRLYAGVLSPHQRPSTSLIRTTAGLLQAPEEVSLNPVEDNTYRTMVVYHLSLRDLGKTSAYAKDDIPARLKLLAPEEERRQINNHGVVELTSNTPSYEIPDILERLEKGPGDDDFVHTLVCTNMISVGVDVSRLGLMVIHGQPKTTSEYIQASSRVGRKHPGLVLTHYSANKPRDRSHYEDFTAYHKGLYKNVEPTSVTPFSAPSRDRSLHAALVLLVRHGCGLIRDAEAGDFDKNNPCIRSAVDSLIKTVGDVNADEVDAARNQLRRLVEQWHSLAEEYGKRLRYDATRDGNQFRSLLKPFGKRSSQSGWPTLHSMRSVDGESPIFVDSAQ